MKKRKFFIISLIAIMFLFVVVASSYILFTPVISCRNNTKLWQTGDFKQKQYSEQLVKFLPDNSQFEGQDVGVKFYCHEGCLNLFYASAAYCLEVECTPSNYLEIKSEMLLSYNFIKVPVMRDQYFIMPSAYGKIGGFNFRVVSMNDVSEFPHRVPIVAFNDELHKIRCIYLIDMSLDYFENESKFCDYIKKNILLKW